jgi:peptidoglycan/xylan/chitin deacetylase (PgdA/CDA1 family)
MIKLFISFATEDFVTPAHYDALLKICTILSKRNIKGSFHLTGDFARSLRTNKRKDLIEALQKHEIGYHGNTHGCCPFIGSVCEDNSWDDAVAILMKTEARGIQDIIDILGHRPKYFVLEFVKAPQLISAINQLGIDTIGFTQIPSEKSSFSWYSSSLCYTGAYMGIESPPASNRLQEFKKEFDNLRKSASKNPQKNIIKIFNHPYKFAYNNLLEAWHDVNPFYRGYDINHQWRAPEKSLYSAAEKDTLFADFEKFIDYTLSFDEVSYHTTRGLAKEFRSPEKLWISKTEIQQLAIAISKKLTYQCVNNCFYSPAEIFGILALTLEELLQTGKIPDEIPLRKLLGPTQNKPMTDNVILTTVELKDIVHKMNVKMNYSGRMTDCIETENSIISHASFVKQMAQIILNDSAGDQTFGIDSSSPEIAKQAYFQDKQWTRPIYPDGFTGAGICRQSQLQTWSYKPAIK